MHETPSYPTCDWTVDKWIRSDPGNRLIDPLSELTTKTNPLLFVEVETA